MPKMTKQDFELIADTLRYAQSLESLEDVSPEDWDTLAALFADALATTNPNFQRARFLEAATAPDRHHNVIRVVRDGTPDYPIPPGYVALWPTGPRAVSYLESHAPDDATWWRRRALVLSREDAAALFNLWDGATEDVTE